MTRLTREQIDASNAARAAKRLAWAERDREANAAVEHRKKPREDKPYEWPPGPEPKIRTGEFYARGDVPHVPVETNERMRLRRARREERRA